MAYTYYYNAQLQRYILQFMAIFQGMIVKTGKQGDNCVQDSLEVPVQYGSKDRVTSAIINGNTQNKPIRLPMMSAYLRNVTLAPDRRKGIGTERTTPFVPLGGLVPDDIKVVQQMMPVPYNTQCDLIIYTSNIDTHFQILEQIFILFDPLIQIQTSDATFDWTKLTTVELTGINFEEQFPAGQNRRMIITTLQFKLPIYIAAPADTRHNIIKDIYLRIGKVDGALTDENILAEFDAQHLPYSS
jgi:hypothetical protein